MGAIKRGMIEHYRLLVGLNGCHLKGCTWGVLLAAVEINCNNSMYPISYAVVESDNKYS